MKSLTRQNVVSSVYSVIITNSQPKIISSAFIAVYSFLFNPVSTNLYIAIASLICFDFLTAVLATFYTKEKITSAKASRTLVKLLVYGIMVSASVLVDRFIITQGQLFADLTMGFIAITEFISILENISKAGYAIPKGVLTRLKTLRKNENTTPEK